MTKAQSMDNDECSGGDGRIGGGGDRGAFDDSLSNLSSSPHPATASGGSSSAPPVFLPADVARGGNDDDATPPPTGFEPPIRPSAPTLSELEAGESEKTRPAPPSVVYATPVPPPFAPHYRATASTTTPDDVYVIPTPSASSATTTTRVPASPDCPSRPPDMSAASPNRPSDPHTTNQPLSTGAGAGEAANAPLSAPANQGGDERRIRKYKLGLVSLGLVAAAAIISAVVAVVVYRPDPPSASPTSAPTTSTITASPVEYPTTASPQNAPTSSPPTASPSASWIWVQQGQAIVGDAEGDLFGGSVAMSADAKTLVVGATDSNAYTGYVKVYRANDDGWSSMQLIGQEEAVYDEFGWSVDISSDGKTVAIGAPEWGTRPGYVRVFYLVSDDFGSSWKQLGQDITGDANGEMFGVSVSLSNDGKTLAVGADENDGNGVNSGCVRIYHLEDDGTSSWEQIGQDIYGDAAGDGLGYSVSLSADGKTVAMGAPWNSDNGDDSGQVRVYQMDSAGSTWEQLGQDINGDAVDDDFGWSVDISSDGKTLTIGAPGTYVNDRPGYVRVYYLESNGLTSSWTQLGQDIIGEADDDDIGYSVSLSDDGKTLAVGAEYNYGNGENSGHVRVYRMDDSSTSWTQVGEDIDGEASGDWSGVSVSLSADGTTVAIGSPYNDDNGVYSGHVKIFSIK